MRDGTRFVFDHHDLCPELYESRFPDGRRLAHRGLLLLERATFRTADRVISTNESYAEIAIDAGAQVTRATSRSSAPVPTRRASAAAPTVPALRRGRRHLVAYLGVMGPQDGVDLVLRGRRPHREHGLGRDDIAFTLMGAGDCYDELVARRDELGLARPRRHARPGPRRDRRRACSRPPTLGLCPDPKNPLNDVSTMNKTMEYMAFELPVVAFDLKETRVSAADVRRLREPGDVEAYARAIVDLLDDPGLRQEMGRSGRRAGGDASWPGSISRRAYVRVFDELRPGRSVAIGSASPASTGGLTSCAGSPARSSSRTARSLATRDDRADRAPRSGRLRGRWRSWRPTARSRSVTAGSRSSTCRRRPTSPSSRTA